MSAAERALRRTIDHWTDDGMTADQLLDFVAGVEAIEAEATAAAEQRLREQIEALRTKSTPKGRFFYSHLVDRAAVLALLSKEPE